MIAKLEEHRSSINYSSMEQKKKKERKIGSLY